MTVYYAAALLLGLAVGSFANVVIYRVPLKKSIAYPPSHCPNCGKPIAFYDNIPLVSYVVLRAKCRHCAKPISIRYPAVEAACGLLFLWAARTYGLGPGAVGTVRSIVAALFLVTLLVLALIDLDHRILPDVIVLPWLAVGLAILAVQTLLRVDVLPLLLPSLFRAWSSTAQAFIGLACGGGLLFVLALLWRGGMGGGDIKLMAVLGIFLGPFVLFDLFVGVLFGSLAGIYHIAVRGGNRKDLLPFGPFLVVGAYVTLLWGERIVGAYLRLTGLAA